MKTFILLLLLFPLGLAAQTQTKPAYCDELPTSYDQISNANTPLPRFNATAITEYKVQVALLRFTDPRTYPFHPSLIARWRPCEEVWVVESKRSFSDKKQAELLRNELVKIGYKGAYITQLVAYQWNTFSEGPNAAFSNPAKTQ
ncbi:MAG: hypothetical protein AAFO07_31210 [Bacteroidota bacterium]